MTVSERDDFFLLEDSELLKQCVQNFQKGSGNGGQKVNKTSSAVRLFHSSTGIAVFCAENRSQSVNRHLALQKLKLQIALNIRTDDRDETFHLVPLPSSENMKTFLPWAARLFDVLHDSGNDTHKASEILGVSYLKLEKVFKSIPELQRCRKELQCGSVSGRD